MDKPKASVLNLSGCADQVLVAVAQGLDKKAKGY